MSIIEKSIGQQTLETLLPILQEKSGFPKRATYPVRSNWASNLGHACERFLYYRRHNWADEETREWKYIGELGNLLADWWIREMGERGFKITHQEIHLNDEISKKFQIGGRIDCRIGWPGTKSLLAEIKTMSDYAWQKINTYEDFMESKNDWVRAYPAQLQIYMLSENEEAGLFVLINKTTLEWKFIPVYLDLGYCEWLLGRAARVNEANDKGIPPKRISYGKTCETCTFKTLCLPDIVNEGWEFLIDDELEAKIKRREELKALAAEFEELDDETKSVAKKIGKDFIVGNFKVDVKKTESFRTDTKAIPQHILSEYQKKIEAVRINFIPLETKNGGIR